MPSHLAKLSRISLVAILALANPCPAQEETKPKPVELQVLKNLVGTWDAAIEVWPSGPDAPSIKFTGVETNRPYGDHWLASDFDSEFGGQTITVHSIVGFDLDAGTLVGTVIDDGPYSASMVGEYDAASKTVHWTTKAKSPEGKPILQKTAVTQKNVDQRVLVLSVPDEDKGGFTKFMRINYVRRK